ncbi:ABC transporter permease [Actinosynnema sp. NPDC047251]|uniref:ABC-type transporter, permease subunit n=1 Tax=Saccharothrix espanaensis (strain ATCC 51144 / DSM 44229 / JCM 9112 / NBRC 15066 / NRRL 15764) TaxID=1179773 RepID=K0K4Y5_SACES|nr:ABC transporter permease [Saccharothrix espanaensis]CCH31934.1 ABC-type transporter, permease subunit [Saccharothrix espanaensis DSM 44229]
MGRFVLLRALIAVPLVLAVSAITFLLTHIVPGDPARVLAGLNASEEAVQRIREQAGLDQPLLTQFGLYLERLVRGDLGDSLTNAQPVLVNLVDALPATIELTVASLVVALALGIPLGVLAATRRGGVFDHLGRVLSLAGVAVPVFWVGIVLVVVFYAQLGWLPSEGQGGGIDRITGFASLDAILRGDGAGFLDVLHHLVLPATTLALPTLARIMRTTRASMLEALAEPYVATARAKGVPEFRVVYVHALRNAMMPVVTVTGLAFGYLLGGSVLVEKIFKWPGVGRYAYDAITVLDYNSVMGVTLVATVAFLVVNLLVDVLHAALDPKVRLS